MFAFLYTYFPDFFEVLVNKTGKTISEKASSQISINGISLGTNDLTGWQLVQRLTQKNRGLSSKVLYLSFNFTQY